MTIIRLSLLACLILTLASCKTLEVTAVRNEFDKSYRDYNKMVRGQELDQAVAAFVDKPIQDEFGKRVKSAKDVRVVDYRVKSVMCDPEKGEAEVKVEFDYYIPPSVRMQTVEDQQKWVYRVEGENKVWRLITFIPEFPTK